MAGKAFAIVKQFQKPGDGSGLTATQINVELQVASGTGVGLPNVFGASFTFDASLTNAQNLAALKAAVVAQCGLNGINLTAADVSVFTAIN